MTAQYTPCQACGAVGEVGEKCQFCGTTIELKEGVIPSNARVVRYRTVTPQQYADKISIYHKVRSLGNVLVVSIGEQYGVINLNGDLIYPLGDSEIRTVYGNVIAFDDFYDKERYVPASYFNLENGQHADKYGFVKESNNPKKLYRVDVENNWAPINTYVNLNGETYSFDYAEYLDIYDYYNRKIYILHHGDTCALYLAGYDLYYDGYDNRPECILEGNGKIIQNQHELYLPILNTCDNSDTLLIARFENGKWNSCRDIFKTWREKYGVLTPNEEKQKQKLAEKETRAKELRRRQDLEFWGVILGMAIIVGLILLWITSYS